MAHVAALGDCESGAGRDKLSQSDWGFRQDGGRDYPLENNRALDKAVRERRKVAGRALALQTKGKRR